MKLSTRARYGARMMFELALHYGQGYCMLKNIARDEDLPEQYLTQVVIPLRTRGLVISERGMKGGYRLAKPPNEITMKDVVETLDGTSAIVECTRDADACDRYPGCVTRKVWSMLDERISEALASVTLQDLVRMRQAAQTDVSYEI